MIEFLGVPVWWSILYAVAVIVIVYTFVQISLLARGQEAGQSDELRLLHRTSGSYEFRDMPTNPCSLSKYHKLYLVMKLVLPPVRSPVFVSTEAYLQISDWDEPGVTSPGPFTLAQ